MTIKPFFQNMIGLLLRLILFEELLLSGSMKKALLCLLSGKLLEIQQRSPDERRDVRWAKGSAPTRRPHTGEDRRGHGPKTRLLPAYNPLDAMSWRRSLDLGITRLCQRSASQQRWTWPHFRPQPG